MLIKLLAPTHPTVLFAITFQNLPDELFNPLAWSTLLSSLSVDNLEPPKFIHALDKATWIPSILEEVTFNTTTLTVSCLFVDGTTEEWPLMSPACLKALDGVLSDVSESTVEAEREREKEKQMRERQRQELARQQSLNSPPTTVKAPSRHKKNRSLLMSLVSTFVNLPCPPPLDRSVSAPITRVLSPEPALSHPRLSPKALRRRARSTLVDTFRTAVLSELKTRLAPGGYYAWIIRSMLRRASEAMADIIMQSEVDYTISPFENDYFPPPSLESTHEDDTDTDGSSVHTPSTPHCAGTLFTIQKSPVDCPRHLRDLSSDDLYEYNQLSAMCVRFRQLLIVSEAQKEHLDNDVKQRDDILEIRSRRRAWQNKTLVGSRNVGLATPYTSSRLSQVMWTAEDYEYAPEEMTEEYTYEAKLELGLKRTKGKSDAKLFPVSEEDDDEQALFSAREYELELGFDEGLRSWKIDDDDDEQEEEQAKVVKRPRARTNSMHQPAAILCERPPIYTHVDVAGLDVSFGGGYKRFTGDEFTLAMDVPFKKGPTEPDKDWLAPRFTPQVM